MSKLLKIITLFSLATLISYTFAQNNKNVSKVATLSFFSKKPNNKPNRHGKLAYKNKHGKQTNVKMKTTKHAYIHHIHKSCADFDKLLIDGNIDVELHSGYSKPSIVVIGDRRDLFSLTSEVRKHTLVLYAGAGVPDYAPIKVIVKGRYIHNIKLKNNASIKGHALKMSYLELDAEDHSTVDFGGYVMVNRINIQDDASVKIKGARSKHLEVCLKDNAHLKISGKANLAKLDIDGKSHFSMTWVDSWNLVAKVSGNAYVQLAGIVNKLDACVYGNAHWNGRFLRSRRTFVKTYDNAVARISAVKKQHTLALGKSDIYFYNLSTYRTDFMAEDGSVLDMRDWQLRAWYDYDQYNKAG